MKSITIMSKMNITVYKDLEALDNTNYKAQVKDSLNIKANWTKTKVKILEGTHEYPAEIKDWSAVKSLADAGVLSVSPATKETHDETVKAESERLEKAEAEKKARVANTKKIVKKLNDIVDEKEGE